MDLIRESKLVDFVTNYIIKNGKHPSLREISREEKRLDYYENEELRLLNGFHQRRRQEKQDKLIMETLRSNLLWLFKQKFKKDYTDRSIFWEV